MWKGWYTPFSFLNLVLDNNYCERDWTNSSSFLTTFFPRGIDSLHLKFSFYILYDLHSI